MSRTADAELSCILYQSVEGPLTANECHLFLVPGSADPPERSEEYQGELERAYEAMKARGIAVQPRVVVRKSAGGGASFVGEFIVPLAQAIGPTLGVVLVAWLQGRSGRKVRMKVGDIEVEARTADELEKLLLRAQELKGTSSEAIKKGEKRT